MRAKALSLAASVLALGAWAGSTKERLELRHVRLELPGLPAAVIPADVDGDGLEDLTVVVAYTAVESVSEDRLEHLVLFTQVVPALFERREVRTYLARPGGYVPSGPAFPLPLSVLAIAKGTPEIPIVALTDGGVAELRFVEGEPASLELVPWIDDPPLAAHAGTLLTGLDWVQPLDEAGRKLVLLSVPDGLVVYPLMRTDTPPKRAQRLAVPEDRVHSAGGLRRRLPQPRIEDIDGDGERDLLIDASASGAASAFHAFLGNGAGGFAPLRPAAACAAARTAVGGDGGAPAAENVGALIHFGDLDGDGRAEGVRSAMLDVEDGASLKQAKQPRQRYAIHPLLADYALAPTAKVTFDAIGHTLESGEFDNMPAKLGRFQDLDGDGRKDLITVTFDLSLFQLLRVLTTKSMTLGLQFHVWAQEADGQFREVKGLDLAEKLRLDLDELTIGRFAQFAGDFDGDGKTDFVHLGRGKRVTLHRGAPGCRYPREPDLVIELEEEVRDLALVRVADFDGDGRSDLSVLRPLEPLKQDASPPVLLDLYLSRSDR